MTALFGLILIYAMLIGLWGAVASYIADQGEE
jgi:hypothetical protein